MKIQYLPTGNIFDLPEKDCLRIFQEDKCNYKFLDKIKLPEEKQNKTLSVDELVVKNNTTAKTTPAKEETADIKNNDSETEKENLIKKAQSLGIKGNLSNCKVETLKKKIAALEE